MSKQGMVFGVIALSLALSSNASAEEAAPPSTAAARMIGGAAGFGVAYALMLPLEFSDDGAAKGRPFAVPVYGPLSIGAQFAFRDSDWAPLSTVFGVALIADGIVQAASLVLMTSGIIDHARERERAAASPPPSKISIAPRASAHDVGLVFSFTP